MANNVVRTYFISYGESDGYDFAVHLAESLRNSFVAKRDIPIGEAWLKIIDKAIDESLHFIVILTKGACESKYVEYEISRADLLGKRILPCKFEKLVDLEIPEKLKNLQRIIFATKEGLVREVKAQKLSIKDKIEIKRSEEILLDPQKVPERKEYGDYIISFELERHNYSKLCQSLIEECKENSTIEIIGVSLRGLLDFAPGIEELAENILKKDLRCRLLMLDPISSMVNYVQEFSKDFGYKNLADDIEHVITARVKALYEILSERKNKNFNGLLEVKLYNAFLSFSYFCVNNEIVAGLYYYHKPGMNSPAFCINPNSKKIVNNFKKHFEKLWEKTNEILMRIEGAKQPINNISRYIRR